jgi:hypothetical protein
LQAPPEHVSVVVGSQALHDPPPVPQVVTDAVLHVLPAQQPLAQDVASQTHWPPLHR